MASHPRQASYCLLKRNMNLQGMLVDAWFMPFLQRKFGNRPSSIFYTVEFHGRFGPESWSVCARVRLRVLVCLSVIVMGSSVGRVMFWVCSIKGGFGLVVVVSGWGTGFAYWVLFWVMVSCFDEFVLCMCCVGHIIFCM